MLVLKSGVKNEHKKHYTCRCLFLFIYPSALLFPSLSLFKFVSQNKHLQGALIMLNDKAYENHSITVLFQHFQRFKRFKSIIGFAQRFSPITCFALKFTQVHVQFLPARHQIFRRLRLPKSVKSLSFSQYIFCRILTPDLWKTRM